MINKKTFFDLYRKNLDPDRKLSQSEVNAIDLFIDRSKSVFSNFTIPQWAYIFATTFHETNATFLPLKEAYWLSEDWRRKNLRYYPYYGRGYVQITWKENYATYGKLLNIDLVKNPDLAMNYDNAFFILINGFANGRFTGKKISDYINNNKKDYVGARRCINGTDKAQLIANYANEFEEILFKSTK